MDRFTVMFAVITAAVFGLTALVEHWLIPVLRSYKVGQVIKEDGPIWHQSKSGTPTMGGIGFILPVLIVMIVFLIMRAVKGDSSSFIPFVLTLAYAVFNGAIGFVDDYCKLIKHENEGLTELQKLFLQLVMASAYVCVMSYTGNLDTAVEVPFFNVTWELGWFYYPLAILVLTGVVNGGNITDGIDGLACSVSLVIGIFISVLAFTQKDLQLSLVGAILVGAMLGFLIYNLHPAKVFMGDTGSLFLGALVISAAFQIGQELVGLIVSAVFIIEMLSSFLQKMVFKITRITTGTGKRLFRMAPLHHHLEKGGWKEGRIVIVFSAVEAAFCLLAWIAVVWF